LEEDIITSFEQRYAAAVQENERLYMLVDSLEQKIALLEMAKGEFEGDSEHERTKE
jgi:hypothetical protein